MPTLSPDLSPSDMDTKTQHRMYALCLAVIPGCGQVYNKQLAKAAMFFVFLVSFIGVFYNFLTNGYWGLFTLGESLPRDNSVFLLAKGIISVIVSIFGLGVYALSFFDAYQNGKMRDEGK